MGQQIGFYKKEGRWYADLPDYIAAGGSEASCVMVAGADTLLNKLCENLDTKYGTYITLELDTKPFKNAKTHIKLDSVDDVTKKFLEENNHPDVDFGGNYIADLIDGESSNHKLWLCPVTLHVFPSGYPKELWIYTSVVIGYDSEEEYLSDTLYKKGIV